MNAQLSYRIISGFYEYMRKTPKEVEAVLFKMTERERIILTKKLGLSKSDVFTYKEIADFLGVTPERIRQILSKAMEKIRSSDIIHEENV